MEPYKAPGPNGFTACFYQAFWEIIKDDLTKEVEESKRKVAILGVVNHTFTALIPKKREAKSMCDY